MEFQPQKRLLDWYILDCFLFNFSFDQVEKKFFFCEKCANLQFSATFSFFSLKHSCLCLVKILFIINKKKFLKNSMFMFFVIFCRIISRKKQKKINFYSKILLRFFHPTQTRINIHFFDIKQKFEKKEKNFLRRFAKIFFWKICKKITTVIVKKITSKTSKTLKIYFERFKFLLGEAEN